MPLSIDSTEKRPRATRPPIAPILLAASMILPLASCSPLPPGDVEAGRQLYLSRGCASCHGEGGRGDGPAAVSLTRLPRDLHRQETFTQGRSIEEIAKTLETGTPNGGMPAAPYLPAEERRQLAVYVQSLAKPNAGVGKEILPCDPSDPGGRYSSSSGRPHFSPTPSAPSRSSSSLGCGR